MTTKKLVLILIGLLIVVFAGWYAFFNTTSKSTAHEPLDPTPRQVTLSGTYVCLPHLDTTGPQTEECAFGLKADDGEYYAINFGQSADSMQQFQSGAHITAEGFTVIKEALSTDHWQKYNMKGIFTITRMIDPAPAQPPVQGKLNINAVCEGALAYMTFADGKSADAFVTECKEGKHPEVIEHYKAQMGAGEGAAI